MILTSGELFEVLSRRERAVLACLYPPSSSCRMTCVEIGREMQLTDQRIRQIRDKAKRKIAEALLEASRGELVRPVDLKRWYESNEPEVGA